MRTFIIYLVMTSLVFSSCKKENSSSDIENSTGSASCEIDGGKWTGKWASALGANIGSNIMTLSMSTTEKDVSTSFSIGINKFNGVGTYTYNENSPNMTFSVSFAGESYTLNELAGGGGKLEVKITTTTAATSLLTPGKLEGTFSGEVKNINSFEVLKITNGKFSALKF